MDRWQIFLEFLHFHRRFIIGCFLVAGLIVFFTKIMPVLPRFEGNSRPAKESATEGMASESPERKGEEPQVPKSKQYYLESEDPKEIIVEALRLRSSMNSLRNESAKLVVADERFQLARRAMGLTPNLQQRRILASELTESILILLQNRKRNDTQFDESEFMEVVRKMRDDTDAEVRSFAPVILTTSIYSNFRNQLSDKALNEFKASILDNLDQLSQHPVYLRQFCMGLVSDDILLAPDLGLDSVHSELTKRMSEHESSEVRKIGEEFAMNYGFYRPVPARLADDLLRSRDEKVESRVNAYFDHLAKHPDTTIQRYQVALDVIKSYISLERADRAGQCIDWVENRALLHRKDKDSAERIRKALEELKMFH